MIHKLEPKHNREQKLLLECLTVRLSQVWDLTSQPVLTTELQILEPSSNPITSGSVVSGFLHRSSPSWTDIFVPHYFHSTSVLFWRYGVPCGRERRLCGGPGLENRIWPVQDGSSYSALTKNWPCFSWRYVILNTERIASMSSVVGSNHSSPNIKALFFFCSWAKNAAKWDEFISSTQTEKIDTCKKREMIQRHCTWVSASIRNL